MTFFGMFWIAASIICFFVRDIKYMVAITIFSMVFQCNNVFVFGGSGVGPQIVTSILFIIRIIIQNRGTIHFRKDMRPLRYMLLIIFIVMMISIKYNLAHEYNGPSNWLLRCIQLGVYTVCVYAMSSASRFVDDLFLYKLLKNITIFLLVVGFIQLLITADIFPRISFFSQLLYNDDTGVTYYYRDNYFRILSTYMEPSYFACYIVPVFYFFLGNPIQSKRKDIFLAFILFEIMLTFSSTAYGSLLIGGLLYILSSRRLKEKIKLALVGVMTMSIMLIFFQDALNSVIFDKSESGSYIARHNANLAAQQYFEGSPIIGVGYKGARSSSLFFTMLAETGIVGTTCVFIFTILLFLPVLRHFINRKDNNTNISLRIAVCVALIAMFIAIPDWDMSPFWMWIYCLQLTNTDDKAFSYRIK